MNIVFFGTSEFAIPALEALIASPHKVLAVVTQPDREKGRQLKVSEPVTKVFADSKGIPVYQPEDVSSREAVEYLKGLAADLFIVISFGQILKKDALAIPKICSINVHASLLPKYRGAAPTNWAIINGEETTGVTVIKMNEKMDEGDIILKQVTKISADDTNITLSKKLSELGAQALLGAITLIEKKKASFMKQDNSTATYAPKLRKEDGLIDWHEPAYKIHNKVRGLLPWPSAYTYSNGKILKIWKTAVVHEEAPDTAKKGEVVDILKGEGIIVKTGSGCLVIKGVQLEGKRPMDTETFLRGHKLIKGRLFSKYR